MEDKPDLKGQIVDFLRKNIALSLMIIIGLGLISYGIYEYKKQPESKLEFVSAEEAKSVDISKAPEDKISIDIQGEVKSPGVYELENGARVEDAIKISGGISSNADQEYISKRLNRAQKLVDGQKIYIPTVGEEVQSLVSTQNEGVLSSSNGLVGINTGSKSSLESLPKIGPVTADKIISSRPYSILLDLVTKKVITQKTYDAIKDQITLD